MSKCPSCGYCPHCGRSGGVGTLPQPVPYGNPIRPTIYLGTAPNSTGTPPWPRPQNYC